MGSAGCLLVRHATLSSAWKLDHPTLKTGGLSFQKRSCVLAQTNNASVFNDKTHI